MSDFSAHKATILRLTKGSTINLMVAKQKAGLTMIRTVADAEAVLKVLTKPKKITPPVPQYVKDRYNEAHKLWYAKEYPAAFKDHGCTQPVFPKVHTSVGLTKYIVDTLTWLGMYGNRINTTGRKLPNGKWITGTTKKGTGDILACIHSRMIFFEVKIGSDTPSEKQLGQQAKVRRSGGEYYFVKTAEQFLELFDSLKYGQ